MFRFLRRRIATQPRVKIPTVPFDPARITQAVRDDLRRNIAALEDVGPHEEAVYNAALSSIRVGRDLWSLAEALQRLPIDGMTRHRAAEISRTLHNKATALINRDHSLQVGLTTARWIYSGAPCGIRHPGSANYDAILDGSHKAANKKLFNIADGLLINGEACWPGYADGCLCIARPVVEGFS